MLFVSPTLQNMSGGGMFPNQIRSKLHIFRVILGQPDFTQAPELINLVDASGKNDNAPLTWFTKLKASDNKKQDI